MFIDNYYYGHRKILKDFSDLNQSNLPGSIQHGWIPSLPDKNTGKRRIKNIPFYCWNKKIHHLSNRNGYKNNIIIGSPFIYYLIKNNISTKKGFGTLVFPAHSNIEDKIYNLYESQDFDIQSLVKETEKKFNGPFTACLYYTQYTKKNIQAFEKNNWKTICCGNKLNDKFLEILTSQIVKHEIIVCTEVCTTVFYSLFLKKKTAIIKKNNSLNINNVEHDYVQKCETNLNKKIPELFTSNCNSSIGYNIACNELGFNYVKSKEDLKQILKYKSFAHMIKCRIINLFFLLRYSFLLIRIKFNI
jgi:hypothetical protein